MKPVIPEGYKVEFEHMRKTRQGDKMDSGRTLDPRGGETWARVFDADGEHLTIGIAVCNEKDNYNKRIGRNISLGRALKNLCSPT